MKTSLTNMGQWEGESGLWQMNHDGFSTIQVVSVLMEHINKSHISNREPGIDFLGDHPHRGNRVFRTPPPVYLTDTSHSTWLKLSSTVIHKPKA